jgi:hypothetical protein
VKVEAHAGLGEGGAHGRADLLPASLEGPGHDAERQYGVSSLVLRDARQRVAQERLGGVARDHRGEVRAQRLCEAPVADGLCRELGQAHVERQRRPEGESAGNDARLAQVARNGPAQLGMTELVESRPVRIAHELVRGAERHELQGEARKGSDGRVLGGTGVGPGLRAAVASGVADDCVDLHQRRAHRHARFVKWPANHALRTRVVIHDFDRVAAPWFARPRVAPWQHLELSRTVLDALDLEVVPAQVAQRNLLGVYFVTCWTHGLLLAGSDAAPGLEALAPTRRQSSDNGHQQRTISHA